MPDPEDPGNATVRASDAERERAVALLRQASVDGRLTLEELLERSGAAYQARDRADLDALTADLPAAAPPARASGGWVLGILGGDDKKGRWRVPERMTVLNVAGGSDFDLREAVVTSPDVRITVISVFGGSDITVPAGTDVQLTGGAMFGGNDIEITHAAVPGSPTVTVRAFSVFGGTDVRDAPRPSWRERLGLGGGAPRVPPPPGR